MYDDQWKNVYTWRKAPIVLERFWRSLKYNEVCMNDYESPQETRHGMERYIHLHNHYCRISRCSQ